MTPVWGHESLQIDLRLRNNLQQQMATDEMISL